MKINTMGEIFGGKVSGIKYEEPSLNEYTTKGKLPEIKLDKIDFFESKVKGLDASDLMKKLKPKKTKGYDYVFSKKGLPSMKIPKNNSINRKLPKGFTTPKFKTTLPKKFTNPKLPKSFLGYNTGYKVPKLKGYNKNFSLGTSGRGFERMLRGVSVGKPERVARTRMKKQKGLPMYGDADKDGVFNVLDCDPLNKWKQGNSDDPEQFAELETDTELEETDTETEETDALTETSESLAKELGTELAEETDEFTKKTSTIAGAKQSDIEAAGKLIVSQTASREEELGAQRLEKAFMKERKKQFASLETPGEKFEKFKEAAGGRLKQAGEAFVTSITPEKLTPQQKAQRRKDELASQKFQLETLKIKEQKDKLRASRIESERKKFGIGDLTRDTSEVIGKANPIDFGAAAGVTAQTQYKTEWKNVGTRAKPVYKQVQVPTGTTQTPGSIGVLQQSALGTTGVGIIQSVTPSSGVGAAQSLGTVGTGVGFAQTLGVQSNLQQQLQNPTYIGQSQPVQQLVPQAQPVQQPTRPLPDSPDIPGVDYIPRGDGTYYSRRSGRIVRYPRGRYNKYKTQQFQQ